MKHTRETVKRHLCPVALAAWIALIGAAFCVDLARDTENSSISIEWKGLP